MGEGDAEGHSCPQQLPGLQALLTARPKAQPAQPACFCTPPAPHQPAGPGPGGGLWEEGSPAQTWLSREHHRGLPSCLPGRNAVFALGDPTRPGGEGRAGGTGTERWQEDRLAVSGGCWGTPCDEHAAPRHRDPRCRRLPAQPRARCPRGSTRPASVGARERAGWQVCAPCTPEDRVSGCRTRGPGFAKRTRPRIPGATAAIAGPGQRRRESTGAPGSPVGGKAPRSACPPGPGV